MRENRCTLLLNFDKGHPLTIADISGDDKVSAMKRVNALLLNGEALWANRDIFDAVVRYIFPSEDHTVQKLLLLFFEIVCEHDTDVFPVVSRYLHKNLNHINEYVRGFTLRFLCRLTDPDLLEPLMASVRENLCHPHQFVRRHALAAVYAIHRLPKADRLLPDAADLVERALATEQDAAARRNAFLFLRTCAQDRAVAFLLADADRIAEWPDLLQMVAVELIPEICYSPDRDEDRYIKIIMSLLSSPSNSVVYECASALVLYSSLPNVAANSYCQLLASPGCDNNVKLIILDRLYELCTSHRDVMVDRVMDLTAIPCTDVDVRRKVLSLVLDLITPQNVAEFMQHLKKELGKTGDGEYRQMLVQTIYSCAKKYPQAAALVATFFTDFPADMKVSPVLLTPTILRC